MNPHPEDWRPAMRRDLVTQTVGEEVILLDRDNERVHQLNDVGAFILSCCDGTRTRDAIVAEVVRRFDVSHAVAAADVGDLLSRMRALEIVT